MTPMTMKVVVKIEGEVVAVRPAGDRTVQLWDRLSRGAADPKTNWTAEEYRALGDGEHTVQVKDRPSD